MDTGSSPEVSIKEIFNRICGTLGNAKDISKKFSQLRTDEDRFELAFDVCCDFLSKLNFKRVTKTHEKSEWLCKVGESKFSKKDDWGAVKAYNESIAHAPAGSEQLALGFFKRSLALRRLSFEEEATEDCSSALDLARTDHLRKSLEKQKENLPEGVEKRGNGCLIGNGEIYPLNGGRSSFLDSASKSVGFLLSEKWGRQLVAEENMKTGEVLLVEKPYASVLLPNCMYSHCSYCFKRSLNLKPCSNCSFAMFCSDKCLKESTSSHHAIECKILDILVSLKLERMELLSLRILLIASEQGTNLAKLYEETKRFGDVKNNNSKCSQVYKSSDFMNIYNLVTNTEKRTASDLFYRSVISSVLIYLLDKHTQFFSSVENENSKNKLKIFSGGLILRFMQNLPCNAHEISEFCEEGFDEIGAGAYAALSLINHSCDPNVVRYSCGDVIVLRVIKPIGKGEQIFDNYGYHYATHSLEERQTALRKQYYFDCECEACAGLWPTYEYLPGDEPKFKKQLDLVDYKQKTDKFEENLGKIFKGNFNSSMIEENIKYLDFLHEFVVLPWQGYNKCQEAIKHCWSFSGNHFRFSKGVGC